VAVLAADNAAAVESFRVAATVCAVSASVMAAAPVLTVVPRLARVGPPVSVASSRLYAASAEALLNTAAPIAVPASFSAVRAAFALAVLGVVVAVVAAQRLPQWQF